MSNPDSTKAEDKKKEPASIAQLAKLNQLVADQKPDTDRLQQLMRFTPDMLKSDLSKVNRFDLCQLIGRELPFRVCSPEFDLEVDYEQSIQPDFDRWIAAGWLRYPQRLDYVRPKLDTFRVPKAEGVTARKFFVIYSNMHVFRDFDLRPVCLEELIQSERQIAELEVDLSDAGGGLLTVNGMHGSGIISLSLNGITKKLVDFNCLLSHETDFLEDYWYNNREHYFLVRRM